MSSSTQTVNISSSLRAPPASIWPHIASKAGINREIWPIHITGPDALSAESSGHFWSVITLLRVFPLDLHEHTLRSLDPGESFHETSRSLLHKRWIHKRSVTPFEGGSLVLDEVEFEPRVFPNLVSRAVRAVFERRHAVLRRTFGKLPLDEPEPELEASLTAA